MSLNLSLEQLKQWCPQLCYSKSFSPIQGVSFDSRNVQEGDLFFALQGSRLDGHFFLEEAFQRGAVAAVVSQNYRDPVSKYPLIYVEDVLAFLHRLARDVLLLRQPRVVAITGSVGKTTTKNFLYTLLSTTQKTYCSPKSYNTQISVPSSILSAPSDAEIVILEMGMSSPGQIKKLVDLAQPYCSGLVKVCMQHGSAFPNGIQGIHQEKSMIFSSPHTQKKVAPFDWAQRFDPTLTTFSLEERKSDFFLENIGGEIRVYEHQQEVLRLNLSFPLAVYYENYLIAVAMARCLGIPYSMIQEGSSHLQVPDMRFQKILKHGIVFINDAYNSCPECVIAAFDGMKQFTGKKIAVLSEMTDLGMWSIEGHTQVAMAALPAIDELYVVGEKCRTIVDIWEHHQRRCYYFSSTQKLIAALKQQVREGNVVLIKGARSYALDSIINQF